VVELLAATRVGLRPRLLVQMLHPGKVQRGAPLGGGVRGGAVQRDPRVADSRMFSGLCMRTR
jgi:hypothetical protein